MASGNTINDLTTRKMCLGKSVGGYLDRKIFEVATFSTVPSAPERDTAMPISWPTSVQSDGCGNLLAMMCNQSRCASL